jgi:hypothetical protein
LIDVLRRNDANSLDEFSKRYSKKTGSS